jgi:transposase, IS5 family
MTFRAHDPQPDLMDSYLASPPKREVLRRLKDLIDWQRPRALCRVAYTEGGPGQPGRDPVVLIKLLLLERLYGLSDVQVVEEAQDRLTFRAFLDLGASDTVPDDSTLVRFRDRLRQHELLDLLFEDIEAQLQERGVAVKEGAIKIVDASLVAAAVHPPRKDRETGEREEPLDPDADFTVRKGKPFYGYKLHMAIDRETGLITQHMVTPASTHDSQVFEELLDGKEGEVFADKAYDSAEHRRLVRRHGSRYSVMKRARRGAPLSAWWRGRNRTLGKVRAFIEGGFATLKGWRGCGRARYRGLEKFFEQMTWGILAHNLTRAVALVGG